MKPTGNNLKAYEEGYRSGYDNQKRENPYRHVSQRNNMTEAWWATGYDKAQKEVSKKT